MIQSWRVFLFLIFINYEPEIQCQFLECHTDSSRDPVEGLLEKVDYSWLGLLQYIHIKNGTPHYFRTPRVILVTRQFVLSTAADAAEVPDEYALGNVAFGDYERDEEECKISLDDIAAGADCDTAVLLMPISDVLLHPEYKHFGAKDSLAILKLIKPIKSYYVLPVCVPFKDFAMINGKQSTAKFFHIDYMADVPRDLVDEDKEVKKLSLLPRELCYLYDDEEHPQNSARFVKNRMACTTGCGIHSGAPTIFHEHTGHWSLVAVAVGGMPCPDPMRARRPPTPPRHLLIFPYVPWITAAIAGKPLTAFAKDDPFGIMLPRAVENLHDTMYHEWAGHFWMGGPRCHDRGDIANDLFRFYLEIFEIKADQKETFFRYYLEIDAPDTVTIVCVKVGMPYRMGQPKVWELNSAAVKVLVPLVRIFHEYKIRVEAFGYNFSEFSLSSSSQTSSCSDSDSDCDPAGEDVEGGQFVREAGEQAEDGVLEDKGTALSQGLTTHVPTARGDEPPEKPTPARRLL